MAGTPLNPIIQGDEMTDQALALMRHNLRMEGLRQRAHERSEKLGEPDQSFLQSLRPQDVPHIRQQLLNWWSIPDRWQWEFALHGRNKIQGWKGNRALEAEEARWWMAETFKQAELYWVSPEMCDVLISLAPSIPDCLPQAPVQDAFVMFAKSIPGTDAENGDPIYTSAMLWGSTNVYKVGPCIAMETYAWRDLVALYRGMTPDMQESYRGIYPVRLQPTGGSEWPLDQETSDFSRIFPEGDSTRTDSMLEDRRILSTFWALASQRITVETRERPYTRQAMRQAQRRGEVLPEVRVIRLREPATRSRGDAGSDVEWSHRWIVGKHWRNQWYPASGQHRPKLIEAYQKGPADKPLKVRETVRALVR